MGKSPFDKRFIAMVLTAAIATFLLMILGNAVRVMNATCPDWPTCYGQFTLPAGIRLIEPIGVQYAHRALALLASLLTIGAAVWAGLRYRGVYWVSRPLYAAAGFMLVEAGLGRGVVLSSGAGWFAPLHMGTALAALALV